MKKVRNIYKGIVAALLLVCAPDVADAQEWAVSTNLLTWVNLGTINAEGSYSIHRNISVNAGFTVNPWQLTTPTFVDIRNKQYGGYVGAKYWPWHVYTEWWIGAKLQYKHFDQVGLFTSEPMKGDAIGAGLSAGYTFMISSHFNLDFGIGAWGGRLLKYEGKGSKGPRNFIFVDNVIVSLAYIF